MNGILFSYYSSNVRMDAKLQNCILLNNSLLTLVQHSFVQLNFVLDKNSYLSAY